MPPRVRKPAVTGADRIPKPSQGFYRDPLDPTNKYRRVTTILDQGVPADALKFWFALTVADSALANLPYLIQSSMSAGATREARDWLKRAPTQKKDERAELGSAVHKAVEATILGTPMPEADDLEIAECLRHFDRFIRDYQVEFTASEMVVANDTDRYAGTLDAMLVSESIVTALCVAGLLPADTDPTDPTVSLMMDTKTGGEICWAGGPNGDANPTEAGLCVRLRPSEFKSCPGHPHPIKGVYGTAALQMAAYRSCNRAWLRDGTTVDMPPTHPVGVVLHLRPDGYLVVPAACGPEVFHYFRHAIVVAEWTAEKEKNVLGQALTTTQKAST